MVLATKSLWIMQGFIFLLVTILTFNCIAGSEPEPGTVDVIAVEYPPYTSSTEPHFGKSFELLSAYAQKHFHLPITPMFLPPARANRIVKESNWCLTFYPPPQGHDLAKFVPLSNEIVRFGFYRLLQPGIFQWQSLNELNGKLVALLRPNVKGQLHQDLINAGINLVFVESVEQGIQLLLKRRVDYAFADNSALSQSSISDRDKSTLQFSKSSVLSANVGFFYNTQCKDRLFKNVE